MGKEVKVLLLMGYGINAERELGEAFRSVGGTVDFVHVQELLHAPTKLQQAHILALPGGFSFGDHLGSGRVLAHVLKEKLWYPIEQFLQRGGLILGICNGFQVLVKMGILPNVAGNGKQEVSLTHNEQGRFINTWVQVRYNAANPSPWLQGLSAHWYPIRHGEGRFISGPKVTLDRLQELNLIALSYAGENPNGSELNIAGITDLTGRILGMMPHPEAFLIPENHPWWARGVNLKGAGLTLFENGIKSARST